MTELALKELQEELTRRVSEDPLKLWYKPHSLQEEFHKTRAPLTILLGGNRAGKTYAAVAEALFYCLSRPIYAPVPNPPVVVWYIMPSLTMFRRSVLPVFKKLVPWKFVKEFSKKDNVVYFQNGSELHFLSSDMRAGRLQGASVDLVIMDETPDETVFEEVQARVIDRKGRVILVFSPVELKSYWVRDKLYLPWQIGERQDVQVLSMPIADKSGNPLVPHFTKEDIEELYNKWPDPVTRAARLYGEFASRSGLIFNTFDFNLHLVDPFPVPSHFSRWIVCDPQYHRFAALFFVADEEGNYFVVSEFFSQDDNLAYRAERLSAIARSLGLADERAVPVYTDYAVPQDIAELNWHFARLSAPLSAVPVPFPKRVEDLILRTQSMLEPIEERPFPSVLNMKGCYGSPRLFFFNNLQSRWMLGERVLNTSRLFWELQRYSWGREGKPDKKSADGADMIDALIYGCSIPSVGSTPKKEEKPRSTSELLITDMLERDALRRAYELDYE